MKLVTKDEFGIVEKNGIAMVSSRYVAEKFEKNHFHILRDIEEIINPKTEISQSNFGLPECNKMEILHLNSEESDLDELRILEFSQHNFLPSDYKSRGKTYPEYLMTKDGFTLLSMGFTGNKAMRFKIDYINKFNNMEQFIKSIKTAKMDYPEFTKAIEDAHEIPKPHHISNEVNMIYTIAIGMNAKKFKQANNIQDKGSIRPYLSLIQMKSVEVLQRIDIGLLVSISDYESRKTILTEYFKKKLHQKQIAI